MRQRFDHLVEELTQAVGTPIPRYRLWLCLHELGLDPEALTAPLAVAFCDGPLADFLASEGIKLRGGARRRLRKELLSFEPGEDGLAEFAE